MLQFWSHGLFGPPDYTCGFQLSVHVNKQNMSVWAQDQPREHLYRSLSVKKEAIWCALGCAITTGLYAFEDADGHAVTVNRKRCIELMRRKFIPALMRKRVDTYIMIYQQDGATPHCSNVSLESLHRYFPEDRLISRRADNTWPAHSPDLFPCG